MTDSMQCWLLKTEPAEFSAQDLAKVTRAVWDGVANALAQKHLRAFKKGDPILIYHTGNQKQVVAVATCSREFYPDPGDRDGKLVVVEVEFRAMLAKPVTLEQIKQDKALAGWDLLRIGRLSVVPTTKAMFDRVLALSK